MTINSITMTGTGGILGLVLSQAKAIGSIAGLVALLPIPLVALAWMNWRALLMIDKQNFHWLYEAERSLHIKGHTETNEKLKDKWLYKARFRVWDAFYALFFVVSIATSIYLFSL